VRPVWRPTPPAGDPAKPHRDVGAVSAGVGPEEIWQEPVKRLLERLATIPSGLDTAEAQARFAVYGYNTAAAATRSPLWLQFLARFRNPLVLILLAASGLSALTGDAASFFIVGAIVLISITLDFVQEVRAENAVEALRRSVAVQTTVRRDGASRSVPIDRLVPGDIVELIAGDLIPATRGYSKAAICSSISRS
jgi:Mg2+-importing ATPase